MREGVFHAVVLDVVAFFEFFLDGTRRNPNLHGIFKGIECSRLGEECESVERTPGIAGVFGPRGVSADQSCSISGGCTGHGIDGVGVGEVSGPDHMDRLPRWRIERPWSLRCTLTH